MIRELRIYFNCARCNNPRIRHIPIANPEEAPDKYFLNAEEFRLCDDCKSELRDEARRARAAEADDEPSV